jgi:hypothetical protein
MRHKDYQKPLSIACFPASTSLLGERLLNPLLLGGLGFGDLNVNNNTHPYILLECIAFFALCLSSPKLEILPGVRNRQQET